MIDALTKLFGSKHDRDVKKIRPVVKEINGIYEGLKDLSDADLQAKTGEFKERLKEATAESEA